MARSGNRSEKLTGTVKSVNEQKGFGFIQGTDGTEYFFHRSAVVDEFDQLERGVSVSFVSTDGPKGPRAEEVEVI